MALMSFTRAYVFLTTAGARRQTPCGQTLSTGAPNGALRARLVLLWPLGRSAARALQPMRKFAPFEWRVQRMDIERINQIGNQLADLTQRTEALRGYL